MYEINFPKFDINANNVDLPRTTNNREKSARERSKLRRTKSTHNIDLKMRPKSHRFRRERDIFDKNLYSFNEVKVIDLEEDPSSNNLAWCVSFDAEGVRFYLKRNDFEFLESSMIILKSLKT